LTDADLRDVDLSNARLHFTLAEGANFSGAKVPARAHYGSADPATWCWTSSPVSAEAGVVSVAACAETALAASLSIVWGLWAGSWWHLLSVLAGPLLLLRTPCSVAVAISWNRRWGLAKPITTRPSHVLVAVISVLPLRVLATVWASALHPIEALASIATNWKRVALCTDTWHIPEPLPGSETSPEHGTFPLSRVLSIRRWHRWLLLIMTGLPALLLRWSLKTATIVYFPLIYIATGRVFVDGSNLVHRVSTIRAQRFTLAYGVIASILLWTAAPIVLATTVAMYAAQLTADPVLSKILRFYLPVPELRLWNVARFLSGVLTVVLFVASVAVLWLVQRTPDFPHALAGRLTDGALRVLGVIRGLLAFYVMVCGVIIFGTSVVPWVQEWWGHLVLPGIRPGILP
jgi:type IV secretory pathway VirB2 component (pilin)